MKNIIQNSLNIIQEQIDSFEKFYKDATEKQSLLDNLKNDIEHEIELDKLSGSEMMKKYKELQACLKLRRKYKNDIEYLNSIRGQFNLSILKGATKSFNETNKKMESKTYRQRIEGELREEILKEISEI